MKRGPKPIDKRILKMRGSWRGDLPETKKVIKAKRPLCPDWLSKEAKKIWRKYANNLYKAGKLCTENEILYAQLCDAQAEFIKISEKLETLRLEEVNDKTELSWAKHKERCRATLIKRANSFGLVPDENKLMIITKETPEKKENEAQQWIEQQKETG